ncbi:MAG: hypothetical protein IJU76_05910 [Desulfovibrionaceae bacterium]|nr:hypothetical protein [Desulfovibrionaceae bacterium]
MANEGFLGKFEFKGERAATDDHPPIIRVLPLTVAAPADIPVGTLLKPVEGSDGALTYSPFLSTDADAKPVAVVDSPCEKGETSVIAVAHGTVKTRVLVTGDSQTPTAQNLAVLAQNGVFAA